MKTLKTWTVNRPFYTGIATFLLAAGATMTFDRLDYDTLAGLVVIVAFFTGFGALCVAIGGHSDADFLSTYDSHRERRVTVVPEYIRWLDKFCLGYIIGIIVTWLLFAYF